VAGEPAAWHHRYREDTSSWCSSRRPSRRSSWRPL